MTQRKKLQLQKSDVFVSSEKRTIERKELVRSPRITFFPPVRDDPTVHIDEQLSHAIYDIEIANSHAMMMGMKK